MSKYQECVLRKSVGHVVAPAFLHKAKAKYPSCFGIAGVDGGELIIDVGRAIEVTDIEAAMEACKDRQMFISMGHYPKDFLDDSVQPFSMIRSAEGKNLVAAFVMGDYPASDQPKSKHSDKFFFANQKLLPKLQELWELAGEDLAQFFIFCKKSSLAKTVLGDSGGKGSVFLLGAHDSALLIGGTPSLEHSFPWGETSDLCGYAEGSEKATEEKVEAKPEKKSFLDRMKGTPKAAEPAKIEEEEVEEEEVDVPDIAPKPGNIVPITPPKVGDTALIKATVPLPVGFRRDPETGKLYYRPPDSKVHGNPRKVLYNLNAGVTPGGPNVKRNSGLHWKDNPPPEVEVQPHKYKRLEDLGVAIAASAAAKGSQQDPAPAKPTSVPETPKPETKPAEAAPLIDVVSKGLVQKFHADPKVQHAMDEWGNAMMNPAKLIEQEKKWPTAAQQIGLKNVNDILRYPPEVRKELCKNHPDFAAIVMGNLIAMVLNKATQEERQALLSPTAAQPAERKLPPHLQKKAAVGGK